MPTAVAAVHDAWTRHVAGLDRVAQRDLEVPERARASRGGHACPERRRRVTGRGHDDLRVRASEDRPDRALRRVERVVGVGVDEPGQERPAGALDGGRGLTRWIGRAGLGPGGIVGLDRADPVAVDDHVEVLACGLGEAVDDADVADLDAHRRQGSGLPTSRSGKIVDNPSGARRGRTGRRVRRPS